MTFFFHISLLYFFCFRIVPFSSQVCLSSRITMIWWFSGWFSEWSSTQLYICLAIMPRYIFTTFLRFVLKMIMLIFAALVRSSCHFLSESWSHESRMEIWNIFAVLFRSSCHFLVQSWSHESWLEVCEIYILTNTPSWTARLRKLARSFVKRNNSHGEELW